MARYRLRYQSTDLEMPVGELIVGRSSSCHLALDDSLVSRRHAMFRVDEEGISIEDLQSRNGVKVNGMRIEGRRTLEHLDRIFIGGQELLLVQVQESDKEGGPPTLSGMTVDQPVNDLRVNDSDEDEPTVHAAASEMDRISEKALALGRYGEAERMLGRRLEQILEETKAGKPISPAQLFTATGHALKLAEGTGKAAWLDWVFSAHDAAGQLLDADAIGRVHHLVRRIRYPGGKTFKTYLANLRGRAATMSPSQRFLLQRLEGIERMVGG